MKNFLSLLFLLPLAFFSCQESKTAEEKPEAIPDIIMKEVFASSQDCLPDSSSCTYVRIEFPVFTDSTKSKLNEIISTKLKTIAADFVSEEASKGTIEHIAQSFIKDFETFSLDYPTYQFGWHVNMKAEITYESEQAISFRIDSEAFTGGAHPNSTTRYFVIDTHSNRLLKTTDIIADTAKFKGLLEASFRQSKGMDENQSYADIGYFIDDDNFLISDNIGLTDDEVVVHFNPYEIAPYSEGATTIEVKKQTLGNLLKVK
jgi:hypothetical protein